MFDPLFNCADELSVFYGCVKCKFKTRSRTIFNKHLKVGCGFPREIRCTAVCTFATHSLIALHSHAVNCQFRNDSGVLDKHVLKVGHLKVFMCDFCDYKTDLKGSLKLHVVTHRKDDPTAKRHQCKFCPYQSLFAAHVRRHEVCKHGTKCLKCDQCEFQTKYEEHLKLHKRTKHSDAVWSRCGHCNFKAFSSLEAYMRHQVQKHPEEESSEAPEFEKFVYKVAEKSKNLHCPDCSYKANFTGDLTRHIQSKHTPDDQVNWQQCDNCSYRTKLKKHLVRHVKTQHDRNRGPARYQCTGCKDRSFATRGAFLKHRRLQHSENLHDI